MLKPIAAILAVALFAVACGTTGEVPPQTPTGSATDKPGGEKPEPVTPEIPESGTEPLPTSKPVPESPPSD